MRKASVRVVVLGIGLLAAAGPAAAGTGGIVGPNSDFPDSDLVMPFDATGSRTSFFAASNVGDGPINAGWFFYDASGELVVQVTRVILGEGGTDIVDITRVADRSLAPGGGFEEGPSQSLAGRRGFVVVIGDGQERLIGSFTIADTTTNAAFGSSAAGMGVIGGLSSGAGLTGTSFSPASLQDNQLILIALNPAADFTVTSLTDGQAPPPGSEILRVSIELHGNAGDGLIASTSFGVTGSAVFSSLQGLFPGVALDSSATIVAFGDEGADYSGGPFDPDGDGTVPIIGFYGQTLEAFGTGQNLRTLSE